MSGIISDLLGQFLSLFARQQPQAKAVNTTVIPFASKTKALVDKTVSCKLLFVSVEGNIKNSDVTTIRFKVHDSSAFQEKRIYGCSHATFNNTIEKLEITPTYGDTRYGRCVVTYEGNYWSAGYVGSANLPNLVIDWIERVNLISLISEITEITNIKNVESVDLIDLITTVSEITNIKNIESVDKIDEITTVKDIKTVGLKNVVIDLLNQNAYTERQSTISNNGETPSNYSFATGDTRRGKFYPRGCRGFLNKIQAYCQDTGSSGGTVSIYLSPFPSMGYVKTADITVPASGSADWRDVVFDIMWNFDSMFIYYKTSSDEIKVAYDLGTPVDYYYTADGVTWSFSSQRFWLKAFMKGETVGDIPVSGTINNIEIPSTSDTRLLAVEALTEDVTTTAITINGSGHTEFILMDIPAQEFSHETLLKVYCDGNLCFQDNPSGLDTLGFTGSTPKISLVKYTADGICAILLTLRFEFKRKLEIKLLNGSANQSNVRVTGVVNLIV